MHLFDLPLDCFRHMMTFVVPEYTIHERTSDFLSLRLTSRLMDAEVLRALQTPIYYGFSNGNGRALPFFEHLSLSVPSATDCRRYPSGYLEFIASFLNTRPLQQQPWNSNISSVLNRIVDEIVATDSSGIDQTTRKIIMGDLCRHIFEMKHWPTNIGCFKTLMYPDRLELPDEVVSPEHRELLYPRHMQFPDEVGSLEFVVLLANVLLGRRTTLADQSIPALMARTSNVFSTLLQVAIKSGQVDLAATLLDTGVDVNDISLDVLETAIECDEGDMMELIFSPKYNLSRSTQTHNDAHKHSRIERGILQAATNNRAEALLFFCRTFDMSTITYDISCAFSQACLNNNFRIAKMLFDELGVVQQRKFDWPIPDAIFYGHKEMVPFLLDRGYACRAEVMMFVAACRGDLPMARFLVRTFNIDLTAEQWCNALHEALAHATPRHVAFVEAVLSDPTIFETQSISVESLFQGSSSDSGRILLEACSRGNLSIVRRIAELGANLDYTRESSLNHDCHRPMVNAYRYGQLAVVELLVELGAELLDPMDRSCRNGFEKGYFPEQKPRKPVSLKDYYPLQYRSEGII